MPGFWTIAHNIPLPSRIKVTHEFRELLDVLDAILPGVARVKGLELPQALHRLCCGKVPLLHQRASGTSLATTRVHSQVI